MVQAVLIFCKEVKNLNIKKINKKNVKKIVKRTPFTLLVLTTSCFAMLLSDEIGVKAIQKDIVTAWNENISGSDASDGHSGPDSDKLPVGQEGETVGTKADVMEAESANLSPENEGILQDDPDEKLNADSMGNELVNSDLTNGSPQNSQMAENGETSTVGKTRYKYYIPQETDSPYYVDAGKIAFTTDYPYETVEENYFDDAAFIGDSRTMGFYDYMGLENADFFCENSMTIYKLLEDEGITYQRTGEKVILRDALQEKTYGKIYMMLGINEYGYADTDYFLDHYRMLVEQIREWQPEAIIYIMANLHISAEKSNMDTGFDNLNINAKNAAVASLANGTDIFYLDSNPLFTDEDGYLNPELTFDGVHLYAQHYDVWKTFLMEHGVVKG